MRKGAIAMAACAMATSAWGGCSDNEVEQCAFGACICVPRIVLPPPPRIPPVGEVVDNLKRETEKVGEDTLRTLSNTAGDSVRALHIAGGDAIATLRKAGGDTVTTFVKAGQDSSATYVKAWRDGTEQTKRSFQDTVDAATAATNYGINQLKATADSAKNAEKRVRDGKVVDAMWGLAVEPLQASEANFAKATQESALIAAGAQSAAAAYGGPGGAAAYAAWATYRATGNAEQALRAGLLAAVSNQAGTAVAAMPSGTLGQVVEKAAIAGAAGGIAVAAAGGDEVAIKDGFLKSAGAVLIQAGHDQAKAYSPKAKEAWDTVQCISARDVDCVSQTSWARDARGRILTDEKGKPRLDPKKLDPQQYIGTWTQIDPSSEVGKKNGLVAAISKLPKVDAIPLMKSKWVLTWTIGKEGSISYGKPTVVLTYVGPNPPFKSSVRYARGEPAPAWVENGPDAAVSKGTAALPSRYRCELAGMERIVSASKKGKGCEAIYRRADGVQQIVWHSDHFPEICVAKAAEFVAKRLKPQGIKCTPQ